MVPTMEILGASVALLVSHERDDRYGHRGTTDGNPQAHDSLSGADDCRLLRKADLALVGLFEQRRSYF